MIYIKPQYKELFASFKNIDDFLNLDIDIVRDFKNRKTGRFELEGRGFYIKKHFACGAGAVLDELLHLRKPHIGAGHERDALDKLAEIGIDTMSVVAFGCDGKLLARQRSFLVTGELTGMKSLEDICRDWPVNPPSAEFRHALVSEVASIAKKMHDGGMNHRDFYICHFLLDISGGEGWCENRKPKLFLIDLHRAQIRPSLPFRWRVKDMGGLYFSAMDIGLTKSDICRFIETYTGKTLRETFCDDRRFWQAVVKRAIKMYRKDFGKLPAARVW